MTSAANNRMTRLTNNDVVNKQARNNPRHYHSPGFVCCTLTNTSKDHASKNIRVHTVLESIAACSLPIKEDKDNNHGRRGLDYRLSRESELHEKLETC
jgi:hypothetical protein